MALRTASVTGNWSSTTTWGGSSVPVEGDYVVVNASVVVTIDAGAAATIVVGDDSHNAIDVSGTLKWGAGSHVIRCKGHVKVQSGGTIEIGTLSTPVPDGTEVYFELNYSAALAIGKYGIEVLAGGTLTVYGQQVAVKGRSLLRAPAGDGGGTANAAVTTTNTTLTDTRRAWATGEPTLLGAVVTCNGKTLTVTSVDGPSHTLTGSGGWSGGGNPGNGNAYTVATTIVPQLSDVTTPSAGAWKTGKSIAIAATDRVMTHHDEMVISAVTANQITCTTNLTYVHAGASADPLRGFVIYLYRNVGFRAYNASYGWAWYIRTTATVYVYSALVQDLAYDGSSSNAGLYLDTTTGSVQFLECLIKDVLRAFFYYSPGSTFNGTGALRDCSYYKVNVASATYNTFDVGLTLPSAGKYWDFSGSYAIGGQNAANGIMFYLTHRQVNISGSRVSGFGYGVYVSISATYPALIVPPPASGYFDNLLLIANSYGWINTQIYSWMGYDLAHLWAIRNVTVGIRSNSSAHPFCDCTLTDVQCIGNPTNAQVTLARARLVSPVFSGETAYESPGSSTYGLRLYDPTVACELLNPVMANNSTADLNAVGGNGPTEAYLFNPLLSSGTPISSPLGYKPTRYYLQRYQQGANDHRVVTNLGTIQSELTTRHTASGYAWKMTPSTTLQGPRLRTPNLKVACRANVAVTLSVWMYLDATLATNITNGNAELPTLRLLGGQVQGVPADVAANAVNSGGSWQKVMLATVTPTEDGALEFCVECDDTVGTGALYLDDVMLE